MDSGIVTEYGSVILPYKKSGEFYVESLGEVAKMPGYSSAKRIFDIVVSIIALAVMVVPMIAIAISIKMTSKGTIFYKQERLGLHGRKIKIVKFRSMHMDAEKDGAQWSTGEKDPRVFPVGQFLRKTHLDELPQLWSIVKGDLSIVGPRPEREVFYEQFETYVHGFTERLKVKPGLTGLAQVSGGYDLKPEEKIIFDVEYIKNRSVWLDINIIFKTVGMVFSGR